MKRKLKSSLIGEDLLFSITRLNRLVSMLPRRVGVREGNTRSVGRSVGRLLVRAPKYLLGLDECLKNLCAGANISSSQTWGVEGIACRTAKVCERLERFDLEDSRIRFAGFSPE